MEKGRSGRRHRFLIPTQGVTGCSAVFVNLFLAFCVLGMMSGLAVVAAQGLRELTDDDAALNRLSGAVEAQSQGGRRVWGEGTVEGADEPPLCLVEHQHYVSGKNGGWRTDSSAWLTRGARLIAGQRVWGLDGAAVRFEPRDPVVAGEAMEGVLRSRGYEFPDGGRLRYECVASNERVFVDACVLTAVGALGQCPDGDVTVITRGDGTPRRRVHQRTNVVAAKLSAGVLLALLVALYLWRALRAGPLVDALRGWNPAPPAPSRKPPLAALGASAGLAWLVTLLRSLNDKGRLPTAYDAGYAFGATVIAGALALALLAWDRRRKLLDAAAPVESSETSRLARAGDGVNELAVRVRRDAPTVGIPDHPPHAFVRVTVKRGVREGRNVRWEHLRTASWPAQVPVEDPTGPGVLDLTEAELDTRATFRTLNGAYAHRVLAQYAQTPFGDVGLSHDPYAMIEIEESYLDPGESLYLYGRIRRVEDQGAHVTYRAMGTTPVVGGSAVERLVVYAGSERSLLGSLGSERAFVSAVAALACATAAAHAATLVWLRLRG